MEIKLKDGKKGEGDKIIMVKTDGWEQITYRDLFRLIKEFFKNEERIYPPPAKGAKYLLDAITRLLREDVDSVLIKYQVEAPRKLHHFI